ncbi:MAG: hypothetical protein WDN44_13270 [Sphingomonas sp.]
MTVRAVLTGAFDTAVGKLPGSSSMGLHLAAAAGALADAGLATRDIDGVLCAYSLTEPHPMLASYFCEQAGAHPGSSARSRWAGRPRASW